MSDRYDNPILDAHCKGPIKPEVRQDGMVRAAGIPLGRLVELPDGTVALQVKDSDRRRCEQRGDSCILVDLESLGKLGENKTAGDVPAE